MTSEHSLAQLLLNELLEKLGQPAIDEKADASCYVCLDSYLSGESPEFPVKLPCGHTAGSRCILKWLSPLSPEGHNSCPLCRESFFHEWSAEHFAPVVRQADPVHNRTRPQRANRFVRTVIEALPSGLPSMEALAARRQGTTNPRLIEIREREMAVIDGRNLFPQQSIPNPSLQEAPTALRHRAQHGGLDVQPHPRWLNFSRPRATPIELPADERVEVMIRTSLQTALQRDTDAIPAQTINDAGASNLPSLQDSPYISAYQPYNQQRRAETNLPVDVRSAEHVHLSPIPFDLSASSNTTRPRAATAALPAVPTLENPPIRVIRSITSRATLAEVPVGLDSGFEIWQAYWAAEDRT